MVTEVDFSWRPFRLLVDGATPLLADGVIILTGASAKYLGLESEKRQVGFSLSTNKFPVTLRSRKVGERLS